MPCLPFSRQVRYVPRSIDADEGRAHLAVLQGEVEKGLEHASRAFRMRA
jgi:hypothetical protein